MKFPLLRDFNTLSRRKKIAAGLINTAIGVYLIFVIDLSMGISPEISIRNIVVMLGVSIVFMYGYVVIKNRKLAREGGKQE